MIRDFFPGLKLIFRVITLSEPPKKDLIPFLQAEKVGKYAGPALPRVALAQFYLEHASQYRQAKVDLEKCMLYDLKDLNGRHAYSDAGEMKKCEKACLGDERVQAAIKALQLPDSAIVVCDPWTYSPDGMNDMTRRCVVVSCFGVGDKLSLTLEVLLLYDTVWSR